MKEYLTIGEVAQIKRISIKSLRYYEHIGILIPAKINPENGYRYYASEQLLTVDMIKFLASMDIPLKQWNKYIDPASGFHLSELIEDSKGIIQEQIHRLKVRQKKLEIAARGLKDNEKYEYVAGFYERRIPARNVLCYPLNEPESPVDFHKKLSILFEIAQEYRVSANYPSGMLMDYSPEKQSFFAYVEIYESLDGHPFFRHFPEHTYTCIRKEPKSILQVAHTEPGYFRKYPYATVIEADCITSPVRFRPYPVELEFFHNPEKIDSLCCSLSHAGK